MAYRLWILTTLAAVAATVLVACGRSELDLVGGPGAMGRCSPGGPGLSDCGSQHENCCTSLNVPGGTFYRTYTNSGDGPIDEADPATVSAYRLDKYLVTVGRFRQFVAAWRGGWAPSVGDGKHRHLSGGSGLVNSATRGANETGWAESDARQVELTDASLACGSDPTQPSTWSAVAGADERLPINCVSWAEAFAFCIWDGGFLPSEAEWEFAAAGGSAQREYPWGEAAPGRKNAYAIYGCEYPDGMGGCVGLSTIAPVGSPPDGAARWGQLDLAGELFEWTLDWGATYVDPCVDCAYLNATTTGHVNRGGDFIDGIDSMRSASREWGMGRYAITGFRCARSP